MCFQSVRAQVCLRFAPILVQTLGQTRYSLQHSSQPFTSLSNGSKIVVPLVCFLSSERGSDSQEFIKCLLPLLGCTLEPTSSSRSPYHSSSLPFGRLGREIRKAQRTPPRGLRCPTRRILHPPHSDPTREHFLSRRYCYYLVCVCLFPEVILLWVLFYPVLQVKTGHSGTSHG